MPKNCKGAGMCLWIQISTESPWAGTKPRMEQLGTWRYSNPQKSFSLRFSNASFSSWNSWSLTLDHTIEQECKLSLECAAYAHGSAGFSLVDANRCQPCDWLATYDITLLHTLMGNNGKKCFANFQHFCLLCKTFSNVFHG